MARAYMEEKFKILIMENICYKREKWIENEGKTPFVDINSDIHKHIHKE
ncbi:hypothetical protein [Fusibacter ferrireducens]|uniref:Uncharacterized protein n=1 Tax=Fusibacter ferrireducens TaxID=2785058 RepID=A0ABR9ZZR1_9FIRM|nr:hypothetical protein [Fusibacter ferrireducens]MBF4695104.1 hypothetical protein [Fusibacter ferrireducens]